MNTQPRLGPIASLLFSHSSASGLTYYPDHSMLDSEYIYIEFRRYDFCKFEEHPIALHTDRQAYNIQAYIWWKSLFELKEFCTLQVLNHLDLYILVKAMKKFKIEI